MRRGAVAALDGTTVLALGGRRGEPYAVSPWEFGFAAEAHRAAGEWDAAAAILDDGLARYPDSARLHYWSACWEALAGRRETALERLRRALDLDPTLARWAADDEDFDSIRDDPPSRPSRRRARSAGATPLRPDGATPGVRCG